VEAEAILERIDRCIRELEAGIHPAAGANPNRHGGFLFVGMREGLCEGQWILSPPPSYHAQPRYRASSEHLRHKSRAGSR
jgi:hypothetical protein